MEPILYLLIGIAIVAVYVITKVSLYLYRRSLDKIYRERKR